MKNGIFIICLFFSSAVLASGTKEQKIFAKDSNNQYTIQIARTISSRSTSNEVIHNRIQFEDIEGNTLYIQEISYSQSDIRLRSVKTTDVKSKTSYIGEYDSKNTVKIITKENLTETTSSLLADSPPLIGTMISDAISRHIDKLHSGEKLSVDIMTNELDTVLGFELKKDGKGSIAGKSYDKISMKPKNFLLALFVPDMYFYVSNTGEVIAFEGPVPYMTDKFTTYLTVTSN